MSSAVDELERKIENLLSEARSKDAEADDLQAEAEDLRDEAENLRRLGIMPNALVPNVRHLIRWVKDGAMYMYDYRDLQRALLDIEIPLTTGFDQKMTNQLRAARASQIRSINDEDELIELLNDQLDELSCVMTG